jgi:endo-1,4-beta-xylanase
MTRKTFSVTPGRSQAGWRRLAAALRRHLVAGAALVAAAATLGALAVAAPAAADTTGEVHAVGAGRCLDVPGSSTTPGTQADIWDCNGSSNQVWTYTSSHTLTVYSGSTQMCLDAYGKGTSAGTKVDVWPCNGGTNQQWNVNSNGTITGVQSGLCLDVTGASTANGALVELWTCNGQSNQQWSLGTSSSGGGLPSSFQWSSSGALISPHADSHNIIAVKDPSVVQYNGTWYVAASTVNSSGAYGIEFLSFSNWSQANSATPVYADQTPIGGGYKTAPMLFYFAPQNLWYLTYQMGSNIGYSTNSNIANPSGWSATKTFYSGMPSIISQNIGSGYWVDSFVNCDSANCYLFSMDDNGHLYRSQTSVANFPNGMGNTVIAATNSNPYAFFEADAVYQVQGQNEYLLMVEAIGSDGRRYYTAYTSPSLAGSWSPLAANQNNPFARSTNTTFPSGAWTQDISSGELIRSNYNQNVTISPCKIQFLYQGHDPSANQSYNLLPWRIGLLTQTNSTC